MTSEIDVLNGVRDALLPGKGLGTDAEDRVAIPGDLPTQPGNYPMLKVRLVSDNKQSLGRHSIAFTTLVTIRVMGEVAEPVDPDDDILVATITEKLTDLKRQAERAVINNPALFRMVQQLVSVSSQFAYAVQSQRLAGVQSDFTFEIFQDADDFYPLEADGLAEIVAADPNHPGVGLTVALPQE